jgi:hypothetical protein
MKTFREYVKERDNNALGLSPNDLGMAPREGKPLDHDQEANIEKLTQVAKTAVRKHPEMMMDLLGQIAEKDQEISSALEAIKSDTKGKGVFRDKGLGHLGANPDLDSRDQVMPTWADMVNGGENA